MSEYIKDRPRLVTAKMKVARLMCDKRWHTAEEIRKAGGSEGLRRMRELRKDGWRIIKRRQSEGSGTWEYCARWVENRSRIGM